MTYEISTTPGLVRLKLSGMVTADELRRYGLELAALEISDELPPNRITDLSEAKGLDLHFAEIGSFAELRRAAPLKNIVRSAIFAPTDVQFGMARMFQTLNDHPKIQIRVFRDLQSAIDWLDGKSSTDT